MQAYDWVEFFAGRANCTSAARLRGASGLKLDINYTKKRAKKRGGKKCNSDYMDITSPSGFWLPGSLSSKHFLLCTHHMMT